MLADIGMPEAVLAPIGCRTFANGPTLWSLPKLTMDGQKYTRGMLTVLAGSQMAGAARMASMGARRAGAGLLTVVVQGNGDVLRATEPGLIVSDEPLEALLEGQAGDAHGSAARAWGLTGPGRRCRR